MMKKIQIIDSFTLKVIALISMFIDHFAATVLTFFEMAAYEDRKGSVCGITISILNAINNNMEMFQKIILIMRIIGRVAFPIYCFLLVKGFTYTRCKWKYALRLLVFAFISELPFDIAFNDIKRAEFVMYNNVFFTLFIGLIFIWGIDYICKFKDELIKKYKKQNSENVMDKQIKLKCVGIEMLRIMALVVFSIVIYVLTILCSSDYGMAGVMCILAMYIWRKNNIVSFVIGTLLVYFITCNSLQLFALMGVIPIIMYNEKKGKSMKWLFYIFYPAHLTAFVLISIWLGIYNF